MPEEAYMYAVPYHYMKKYGVRRYGFHGTSHRYVSHEAARFLGKPIEDGTITVHLEMVSLAMLRMVKLLILQWINTA